MTLDPNAAASQRYHDRFDVSLYNPIGEFVASNLNANRDDARVVDLMVAVQNAALELCGDERHAGAWHRLAVCCGRSFLSTHTIDAIWRFLRAFSDNDTRLDDFEATAKGMLLAYRALDELKAATAHANGVHGWHGRMAYDLLAAVELFTGAANALLAHEDETYIREKLQSALHRVTGALYEGIRHSDQPALFDFRSTYFPSVRDR
ncbi:MAG: hypothetical protein KME04_17780 [Pleurocapsa minor GSE-CHR-MK-17-07R]|jgi:hypothetical protein|nr:hypothetical protein [Pleurocapsa minor GSE-CHR-MK 17-07R]